MNIFRFSFEEKRYHTCFMIFFSFSLKLKMRVWDRLLKKKVDEIDFCLSIWDRIPTRSCRNFRVGFQQEVVGIVVMGSLLFMVLWFFVANRFIFVIIWSRIEFCRRKIIRISCWICWWLKNPFPRWTIYFEKVIYLKKKLNYLIYFELNRWIDIDLVVS